MPTPWITNRYHSATRNNYTLTSTIGNDVTAVLENRGPSDARIQALADYIKPLNEYYQQKFAQLDTVNGAKEGASYGLRSVLAGMRTTANQWRKAIANVYEEHTEDYKALLPDGIGPFTKGKQTSILQAVQGLSGRLTGITALSTTKTSVDNTYILLNTKNANQKGKMGARDAASDEVEQERINLCNALMYVEGGLIQIFLNDLAQVDAFFPVNLLRRRPQTEFTGSIAGGKSKFIVKRKQEEGDEIRLQNVGNTSITFYFSPAKDAPFTAGMISKTITPTQDITIPATELGASDENVYLMVKNDSEAGEGNWFIVL